MLLALLLLLLALPLLLLLVTVAPCHLSLLPTPQVHVPYSALLLQPLLLPILKVQVAALFLHAGLHHLQQQQQQLLLQPGHLLCQLHGCCQVGGCQVALAVQLALRRWLAALLLTALAAAR
jgi:hypothetical protein